MMSQRYATRLSWMVFVVVLALWSFQTKTSHDSWNESSRLAAIESLVERGTWRIDGSPYGHETGDKIQLNGHYYSTKPPLLSALAALLYGLLHHAFGATLAVNGCVPGSLCVYYWLTLSLVGLPSAWLAATFYQLVQRQNQAPGWALALTTLLCFGSMLWPYSLVFNNHVPAAAALFGSFYLLCGSSPSRAQLFWSGLLVGTAVMFDLTSIFLAAALFGLVYFYQRRGILFFSGGGLIPIAVTLVLNAQISGSLFLPYFFSEGYDYPGGQFAPTVGGQSASANLVAYTLRSMVGDHGLLGYCPLLLFGLTGLGQVVLNKELAFFRGKSVLILAGISGHVLFVWLRTNNFGGDAYGLRYVLSFIPILFFYITFLIPASFSKPISGKLWAAGWGLAAALSVFSAYQGVRSTWHQVKPPFFLASSSSFPYLAVQTNLALAAPTTPPDERSRARMFEAPPISQRLDATMHNEVVLLGYDLPARRVQPGETLSLTLYWQLLRAVRGDYFVYTHLLDASQNRQGGLDRRLQEGYPIAFWYPGEVVLDQRQIPIDKEAPAGLAWIRLGGYEVVAGQAKPLPLLGPGQSQPDTSLLLEPIVIGVSPKVVERDQLKPQQPLAVALGTPALLALRGYDLNQDASSLHLKLYWESLAPTSIDWTTFVHVRNEAGKIVAQKDGPAGTGQYPTSLWLPGEIVADSVVLPLENPAPPNYQIVIGLYDLTSGVRLNVPGSLANEITLN
jgi:hypothetical protein